SDIYALGATLLHLLTNVKPPDALSRAASVVNGQPDPLPLANQVRSEISAGIANVLNKAMSQRPDDRVPTASAMSEALQVAGEHPGADAATLVTRGGAGYAAGHTVSSESATRINAGQTQAMASPSFSSEAKTLVAGEATKVATVAPGAVSQARGRQGLGGWIAAGILLL